jgi:hypothetical protein
MGVQNTFSLRIILFSQPPFDLGSKYLFNSVVHYKLEAHYVCCKNAILWVMMVV